MALARFGCASDLLTTLARASNAGNLSLGEIQCSRHTYQHKNPIHLTSARRYPDAPALPLPNNVSEIFANETGRFTPERARDITAPVLLYSKNNASSMIAGRAQFLCDQPNFPPIRADNHVDSYDCFGAVSLNGTMQSNVPKPYCSRGKSMHLNMPGGQWARGGKYIAEDMQNSHYRTSANQQSKLNRNGIMYNTILPNLYLQNMCQSTFIIGMEYSTSIPHSPKHDKNIETKPQVAETTRLKKRERLKQIIKEYGSTVIAFHIGISLISLGACYIAVISHLDVTGFLQRIMDPENEKLKGLLEGASSFAIAYSIHKCLAPIRISITLACTPILVKYLRRKGVLRPPKVKTT